MHQRKLLQLNSCKFNYIGHEQEVDGFIAHELQEVVPYAVTGETDALNEDGSINAQQFDPSKLIALFNGFFTGATQYSEGATGADRLATRTASEPLVDKLRDDYMVIDAELVLYVLHVVVVRMQVHAVVLQSVEPMHDMRTARIYVAVAVLILDVVVDVVLVLEKVGQVWCRLLQHAPHLHIDPFERLVWLIAIGIKVLVYTVVFG